MRADTNRRGRDWSIGQLLNQPDLTETEKNLAFREQITALGIVAPVFLLAQMISVSIAMLTFWGEGAEPIMLIWASVVTISTGFLSVGYRFLRRDTQNAQQRAQYDEAASMSVLALGVIWGALPVIVSSYTDPLGLRSLGIILAGTIFVGGFMLSRTPRVAASFVWPITIGVVFALQLEQNPKNDLLSVITIVQSAVVLFCIHVNHRVFLRELQARHALKDQSEVIGMLLKDFGESSSDWLWQTNSENRIVCGGSELEYLSDDMSRAFAGKELIALFDDTPGRSVLQRSIQRHQAFQDILVQCRQDDSEESEVWWSLTGKPVYEEGVFVGFRGVAADVTENKANESRINYMARFDGLTGLPNRMTLHTDLSDRLETARAASTGECLALVLFDLDNFKWVNDTLGHPAGDALLVAVSERVANNCCNTDLLARFGGDEFALLVRRKDRDEFISWLDGLIELTKVPYEIWGSTIRCSISVGVRWIDAKDHDPNTLIKNADQALYHAKDRGRGRWEEFTEELDQRARHRRMIGDELQRAMSRDELVLHYQPQVCAKTSKLVSCEALIRWNHPTRGLVMPGSFITHAEDLGMIGPLGEWAIRTALMQATRLPRHVKVAVNMSPLQIHSSTLLSTIINALARSGMEPERLELEITETVLMNDTDFTVERLHKIRELGVRIALDDFGTGYSSLSYLSSFPFDKIKIDQSFVRGLETSSDRQAITRATIDMAKALGMSVTAEGVETEFQRKFLADRGTDTLQGFLISPAVPLDELASFTDVASAPKVESEIVTLNRDAAVLQSPTKVKRKSRRKA